MSNEFISVAAPLLALWLVIPAALGNRIAYNRGRSRGAAVTLCLLFGWFGLLIVGCWRKDWEEIKQRQVTTVEVEAIWKNVLKQIQEGDMDGARTSMGLEPEAPRRVDIPPTQRMGRRS